MSKIKNIKTPKKERDIDKIIMKQAHDDKAWEKEKKVIPKMTPTSIRLDSRTIERAKFFAKVHKQRGYQTWLKKIIEERIDTEYEIFQRLGKETI